MVPVVPTTEPFLSVRELPLGLCAADVERGGTALANYHRSGRKASTVHGVAAAAADGQIGDVVGSAVLGEGACAALADGLVGGGQGLARGQREVPA